MNGGSANLYVGSGGIVLAATNAFTQTLNLTAGTVGAKASWYSDVGITFVGSGTIIKAADVSDVARNIDLSGVLTGTGGFTKSGGGTLLLTNSNNTFSGIATISAGILRSTHANALQNAVLAATGMDIEDGLKIATGITSPVIGGLSGTANFELVNEDNVALALRLGNTNATYGGTITGSGSLEKVGSGNQGLTAAVLNHTGGTTLTAGTMQLNDTGNTSATFGSGTLTMNGGRLRLNSSAGATFNGDLVTTANGGEFSYRSNGFFNPSLITNSGTLTLTSDNNITVSSNDFQSFTGALILGNGSGNTFFRMVSPFDNTSLGATAVHLASGAQLTRNHGTSGAVTTDIGTFSGAATAIVGASAAGSGTFTFSVGSRNESATYAGTIVDGGTKTALTKVGTNTQTLSGINTYTGATMISAGTLALSVDGSIAESASVTIAAGAKLDTTGKSSTYAPSNTQPFTFGLDAEGAGSSGWIDAASIDISNVNISFAIAGTLNDSEYVLANYSGTLSGTFAASPPSGYTFDYGTGTNSQIKLVSATGSGYESWASLNGASTTANEDHDNDGVANGVEFFIGGAGGNTTGFTPLPGVTTVGSVRSVTWTHAADYVGIYGIDFAVQTSATLALGSWTNESLGGNLSITGDNVTYTFPEGQVKNFVRLVVTP